MAHISVWIILVIYVTLPFTEALRLLVFFPISAKSHSILGHGVVDNLLAAGHEVVHITAFPKEKPLPNLKEIDVSVVGARVIKSEDYTIRNLVDKQFDPLLFMSLVYEMNRQILEEPEVNELLGNPKEKFDGVILEWFFSNFVAGLAPLFQAPLIWVATTEAHWQVMHVIDEVTNPAYSVDMFSNNSPPLNLKQRLEELYTIVKRYIQISYYITPKEKISYNTQLSTLARKRGVVMPSYDEAVYNASFLLINSHPSFGTPYRLPQNAKYIAGYHISTDVKPLPMDLQKIMDEAKQGVIYFSMGSNFKSSDMSENMKNSLMKMFAKLDETVIWKFESDLENVPKNVHLVKWAPQQSILAHSNLKFFITHGGQLSTIEAIHYGVPVIGVPILGDQHVNMKSVSNKGFGITVDLSENSLASDLFGAISQMKTNPKYKRKALELSAIYHNRQQKPGEELVYWIEYVITTGGATHLRSPAMSLPLYKKLYLDVLLMLISLYLPGKSIRRIVCKRCRLRRSKNKEKSK